MRKITVIIALLLVVAVAMPAQTQSFPDVSEGHWAYEAVNELVAAGVIEGYPDGEYKGQQSMTRYEMAMIIARMLENINDDFSMMEDDIDALNYEVGALGEGLTADQADDVAAIVQSMLEEQTPEMPEGLTEEQSEQVVNLIRALTAEFRTELRMLDSDLGALRTFVEDDSEEIREMIADLRADMERVSFSGNYSVNFEHKVVNLEDEDAEYPATAIDGYYLTDVDLALLQAAGVSSKSAWYAVVAADIRELLQADAGTTVSLTNPLGTDHSATAPDYTDYDSYADHVDAAVDEYNSYFPSEFQIKKTESEDYDLPGWDGYEFAGWENETGFTQELALQLNLNTEFFDAVIELDVFGDEDEVSLDSAGLELENDFLKGVYAHDLAVSMNDFAVHSETLDRGVTVEFKEWGLDTFFGSISETSGADESDQFIFDYDEDGELDDFNVTFPINSPDYEAGFEEGEDTLSTDNYYLMGAMKDFNLGDFTISTGAAMRSDRYEFTNEDNNAIVTLGTGMDVSGLSLNVDSAFSMTPFADDFNVGTALFADATTTVEDVAELSAGMRWKNEAFSPLYGNDAIFDADDAGYDKYVDGLADDVLAFNLRADQLFVDLFDAYVMYDRYDEDWRFTVGGGIEDVLMDGVSATASFERVNEAPETTDTINAGLSYDVDPLTLGGTFQMVMLEDGRTDADGQLQSADEMTFGANGSFKATENLSLNASYELIQNLGNYAAADFGPISEDPQKQTITVGADFADYEVIENLTVGAGASYSMITGEAFDYTAPAAATDYAPAVTEAWGTETLDMNVLEVYANLEYVWGRATFGNDFVLTNKTGESLDREGNLFDNTFSMDYEIVENVDFTSSWQERMMRFSAPDGAEDLNWSTREIKAGVSVDF